MIISRSDNSIFARWWWSIDKYLLSSVFLLVLLGIFLSFSASPAVSVNQGYDSYHYVIWHILFSVSSLGVMFAFSLLNLKMIRRVGVVFYIGAMLFTIATLFVDDGNKGASRWIRIFGISLQPSEFVKPLFAVLTAWLLDIYLKTKDKTLWLCIGFTLAVTVFTLLKQPDLGMTIVIFLVWMCQLILSGIPLWLLFLLGGALIGIGVLAFFIFDHVHYRIVALFASDGELGYQVKHSLMAFQNGGVFGKGAGEGIVRSHIPDAHTDFVFAVAGEEYGMLFCMLLVGILAFIVIRSLLIASKEKNTFLILSLVGLICIFGLQGIVNICSTLHLGPTKGMTLPFISYGGSSTWASAMGMGMILAITRKNVSAEDKDE